MKQRYISSVSDYIAAIEQLRSYYPVGMISESPVAKQFLFRGHCDSSYELIPGVFRKTVNDFGDHKITNHTYLAWETEIGLLKAFIHEASAYINLPPTDVLHWAEYAQHYGVPTRFLDWSTNPLVALYFACKDKTNTNGTVWLLHSYNYHRFVNEDYASMKEATASDIITDLINGKCQVEHPVLYTPYYVDSRMSAQQSFFMVWGKNQDPLDQMIPGDKFWMDLPEKDNGLRMRGMAQREEFLFRFDIHADRKQPLLHELDMIGINEKTLFPGLDGIGRYVERQYRFDYKETVATL